ncbi:MAG TPA: FAD-dependent 5-carboxymethylaminomethyl-2-thiouridine(34) oxidoreductase MnmC, partial [Parvularculaceae bacterium]|nr:FAD-dependent 5-carboxymethylaminomethyl-2-thiouridine(34) oxidoreductase MnmC [Parvularculaceae bacterium]
LDLGDSAAARFYLLAYVHAVRLLNGLTSSLAGAADLRRESFFNQCGVLLTAKGEDEIERQRKILAAGLLPEGWIEPRRDGAFFPQAGVVDPEKFVRALAAGAEIIKARAQKIGHENEQPVVFLEGGAQLRFDAVILANGIDALKFAAARTLPLSAVAGQIDRFADAAPIPHALAFGPYAAPAPNVGEEGGGLVVGATYEKLGATNRPAPSRRATEENIAALARLAPEIAAGLCAEDARPRVSIRCQTPDRLPVSGPLPDVDYYGAAYDDLRLGAARDHPRARMAPGLYILSGLGSRGLVTAPFAAKMLIGELTGDPVDREIAEALHPARFFIRDLKRAQTIRKT